MRTSKIKRRKRTTKIKGQDPIDTLNPQMMIFVKAMQSSRNFNSVEAAREAGYKDPSSAALRLMNNKKIQLILGRDLDERAKKHEVKAERLIEELKHIAFANPQGMLDKDGNMLPLHKWPEDLARALSGCDVETRTFRNGDEIETVTEIKPRFWNKLSAIELLGKHIGAFLDKLKHEHELDPVSKTLLEDLYSLLHGPQQITDNNVIDVKAIEHKANE